METERRLLAVSGRPFPYVGFGPLVHRPLRGDMADSGRSWGPGFSPSWPVVLDLLHFSSVLHPQSLAATRGA